MALELVYSYLFVENLEKILLFYDERNGNSNYSQKLLKRIQEALQLLTIMPEMGRMTDFHDVRILLVDRHCIDYQIRTDSILIINIYSTLTDPSNQVFTKK